VGRPDHPLSELFEWRTVRSWAADGPPQQRWRVGLIFWLTSKLLSRLQNISRRTVHCPSADRPPFKTSGHAIALHYVFGHTNLLNGGWSPFGQRIVRRCSASAWAFLFNFSKCPGPAECVPVTALGRAASLSIGRCCCFFLPTVQSALGKGFAECPIKNTRQTQLCQVFGCGVMYAVGGTWQNLCRVHLGLLLSASESCSDDDSLIWCFASSRNSIQNLCMLF